MVDHLLSFLQFRLDSNFKIRFFGFYFVFFFLNKLKTAYIRTLQLIDFFNIIVGNKYFFMHREGWRTDKQKMPNRERGEGTVSVISSDPPWKRFRCEWNEVITVSCLDVFSFYFAFLFAFVISMLDSWWSKVWDISCYKLGML